MVIPDEQIYWTRTRATGNGRLYRFGGDIFDHIRVAASYDYRRIWT